MAKKKKKIKPNIIGVMTLLNVYPGGFGPISDTIGQGWVLYSTEWEYKPVLIAHDGSALPEGWYTLQGTDQKIVLISENIH